MSNPFIYTLKTATASVLLSPFALIIANGVSDPSSIVFIYVAIVLIGVIAAIPTIMIFWPSCYVLNLLINNTILKKTIFCLLAVLLIGLEMYFILSDFGADGPDFDTAIRFVVSYVLCTCLAIWYYQIKPAGAKLQRKLLDEHI